MRGEMVDSGKSGHSEVDLAMMNSGSVHSWRRRCGSASTFTMLVSIGAAGGCLKHAPADCESSWTCSTSGTAINEGAAGSATTSIIGGEGRDAVGGAVTSGGGAGGAMVAAGAAGGPALPAKLEEPTDSEGERCLGAPLASINNRNDTTSAQGIFSTLERGLTGTWVVATAHRE